MIVLLVVVSFVLDVSIGCVSHSFQNGSFFFLSSIIVSGLVVVDF